MTNQPIEEDDNDNRGNLIQSSPVSEETLPEAPSSETPSSETNGDEHPYQKLTPDTVIDAVESTGRYSDARILALNSYENRVYQVGIEDSDPVIAKFYRPERWTVEQIDEEHRFTQYLFDEEIPVVPALVISPDSDTPTLSSHEGFMFALYRRQGGRAPQLDDLEHLHQLGLFIGRIHAAGKAFPLQHRIKLNVSRFGSDCVEYLLANNFIPSELIGAYEAVTREILEEIAANNPESDAYDQITLHGDCHPGNVLWRDDRPHFVDFDDVLTGPAIQDLWMLLSGDVATRQKQLAEIVEGYEMFMPFNLAELRLIEPLRTLRMMHYSAWLARRWKDPAFPISFPWFNTPRYWSEHILECKEQLSNLREPALTMPKVP